MESTLTLTGVAAAMALSLAAAVALAAAGLAGFLRLMLALRDAERSHAPRIGATVAPHRLNFSGEARRDGRAAPAGFLLLPAGKPARRAPAAAAAAGESRR